VNYPKRFRRVFGAEHPDPERVASEVVWAIGLEKGMYADRLDRRLFGEVQDLYRAIPGVKPAERIRRALALPTQGQMRQRARGAVRARTYCW
jgi:hypothetical protein